LAIVQKLNPYKYEKAANEICAAAFMKYVFMMRPWLSRGKNGEEKREGEW